MRHNRRADEYSLSDLAPLFSMPVDQAAAKLGVGRRALKQHCRTLGLKRWPYRRVTAVERHIVQKMLKSNQDAGNSKETVSKLENFIGTIYYPSMIVRSQQQPQHGHKSSTATATSKSSTDTDNKTNTKIKIKTTSPAEFEPLPVEDASSRRPSLLSTSSSLLSTTTTSFNSRSSSPSFLSCPPSPCIGINVNLAGQPLPQQQHIPSSVISLPLSCTTNYSPAQVSIPQPRPMCPTFIERPSLPVQVQDCEISLPSLPEFIAEVNHVKLQSFNAHNNNQSYTHNSFVFNSFGVFSMLS